MREEEIVDDVMEIDKLLSEAELALSDKKYAVVLAKIKQARSTIEDLREDDESRLDEEEIEMDVMQKLK